MISFAELVEQVREGQLTVDEAVALIDGEDRLRPEQVAMVDQVVQRCRESGRFERLTTNNGDEYYAYRHGGTGVSWGVNGAAAGGFCIARGTRGFSE